MRLFHRFALAIVPVSLAACSGSGGGSSVSGTPVVTATSGSPSTFVRPKLVFKEPVKSHHKAKGSKYLSAGAEGVTVTLISSAVGLSNLSATTDLTAPGVCVNNTCTVYGPPIPPGSDTLSVTEYAEKPTGNPLAEPSNAHAVATSSSTAAPAQNNPAPTILAGQDNNISVTLYGVPAIFAFIVDQYFGSGGRALSQDFGLFNVAVEDYLGNSISGEYSEPVTISDSDTSLYGTSLSLNNGSTTAATETLNSSTDLGNLVLAYGGQAEVAPTISATAGGVPIGSSAPNHIYITLHAIVVTPGSSYSAETQTPGEIDLFAESGPGSTAAVTLSEIGWSNSPYNQTFSYTAGTCSPGTPATTYDLTTADDLTFTDTAPAGAAPGNCTITFTDFPNGQGVTETLAYTEPTNAVNAKTRHGALRLLTPTGSRRADLNR
jgi:hypothetical protein